MVELDSHWSYDILKKIADEEAQSHFVLERLKTIFATEIDSVRRRDCIRSIGDLIDCLERRDALSEFNIQPIRELANHCGGQRLQEALSSYTEMNKTGAELTNQYQEQRLAEQLRLQLKINGVESPLAKTTNTPVAAVAPHPPLVSSYPVAVTQQKRSAIYKVISQEIGSFWRRLGRELEIGEGAMDEIELQFPRDLSSRVYRLLQLFEEDDCHDPKQDILLICRALEECKRKDLRRKVENIMSH